MDSALLHLGRGRRSQTMLGLTSVYGEIPQYTKDYLGVYVPFGKGINISESSPHCGEDVVEAKKGNRVWLVPRIEKFDPRARVLVEVNPVLFEVAEVSFPHIIEAGNGGELVFRARMLRDFDLSTLTYLCRLYVFS